MVMFYLVGVALGIYLLICAILLPINVNKIAGEIVKIRKILEKK